MSKSDTFEADLLKLIFQGVAIANLADNAATSPLANLYIALHTADPGEAGNQSTSEVTYTGYARVAVARTTGGFTVSGTSPTKVELVADVLFGTMTAGSSGTATYFSIGVASSGAGKILYSGTLTPSIPYSTGIQPKITGGSGNSSVTED